jgi:hypothetical protein
MSMGSDRLKDWACMVDDGLGMRMEYTWLAGRSELWFCMRRSSKIAASVSREIGCDVELLLFVGALALVLVPADAFPTVLLPSSYVAFSVSMARAEETSESVRFLSSGMRRFRGGGGGYLCHASSDFLCTCVCATCNLMDVGSASASDTHCDAYSGSVRNTTTVVALNALWLNVTAGASDSPDTICPYATGTPSSSMVMRKGEPACMVSCLESSKNGILLDELEDDEDDEDDELLDELDEELDDGCVSDLYEHTASAYLEQFCEK